MSRILGLYPAAWRERYRSEVEELLVARPPTAVDLLDLFRGALDAWVHPQVRRRSAAAGPEDSTRRWATLLAGLGGVLFIGSGLRIAAVRSIGPDGYRDNGFAIPFLILAMLLTGVAALLLEVEPGRRRRLAGVAIGGAILTMLPWPILIVGFFTYVGATIALGLLLVRRGRMVGLLLVAIGVVLPVFNTEHEGALAAVPVGILWIAFAIVAPRVGMSIRARATESQGAG